MARELFLLTGRLCLKGYEVDELQRGKRVHKKASQYGIVPGLDNISNLCDKLGNPQNELDVIHIAGTNGKGSVGAFAEQI